mmetsp:Transcript_89277/g.154585  ORF Transcript_89277/g.154585 Transcript_89277/m.154585 type:complete len:203 (-) Transcript_89277:160-768(-)
MSYRKLTCGMARQCVVHSQLREIISTCKHRDTAEWRMAKVFISQSAAQRRTSMREMIWSCRSRRDTTTESSPCCSAEFAWGGLITLCTEMTKLPKRLLKMAFTVLVATEPNLREHIVNLSSTIKNRSFPNTSSCTSVITDLRELRKLAMKQMTLWTPSLSTLIYSLWCSQLSTLRFRSTGTTAGETCAVKLSITAKLWRLRD